MEPAPSHSWKHRLLWAEFLALFIAVPLSLYFIRHLLAFNVIPLVILIALICGVYLWRNQGFDWQGMWSLGRFRANLCPILLTFAPAAALLTLASYFLLDEHFCRFPRERPLVWLMVMLLYPLLAALPQELVFRTFFFQRYEPLFGSKALLMLASAFSFALAHVWYANWIAPTMSLAGGLLFAYRYERSGSLLAVGLEHGLWGNFLFTVGLGWYFYSGSIR